LKLTVIVPVYNKIEVIQRCIELNIIHCKFPCNWVIIDNHSDENTKQGLNKLSFFAESLNHTFLIISESENTGVAKAWNKGLSISETEFVCILNNDCVMMPNWDEKLITYLEYNHKDLISPFVVEQMIAGEYTLDDFLTGTHNWKYICTQNQQKFRKGVFGGVVFFGKREVFRSIGNFDEQFWLSCEDIDYCVRALKLGLKIGVTGSVSAFHLTSSTRGKMQVDYSSNQDKFQQKWGWRYENVETNFINKLIKKWHKVLLIKYLKMSDFSLSLPV
jgi:GT2 family glycosyltransferase